MIGEKVLLVDRDLRWGPRVSEQLAAAGREMVAQVASLEQARDALDAMAAGDLAAANVIVTERDFDSGAEPGAGVEQLIAEVRRRELPVNIIGFSKFLITTPGISASVSKWRGYDLNHIIDTLPEPLEWPSQPQA